MGMDSDVKFIGAGLTGLVAARQLEIAGRKVIILDKEHSVGGRLATQRFQNGIADYGAQFFTARTETFQKQVALWQAQGIITIWSYNWSDGSIKRTAADGHPRYIAQGGMNQLAQDLAASLHDVRRNVTVSHIHWLNNSWQVVDNNGLTLTSRSLILTPPVPQSLNLLNDVPLADEDKQALRHIHYAPCLCGLFVVDGAVNLPEPGAVQDFNQTMYWIADNQAKGISPNQCIITVHAEERYSRQHYDNPNEETLNIMREYLQKYMGVGASIKEAHLKKWCYGLPLTTYPHDILKADGLPLLFAGDAFGGRGRVEGAYLSGLAVGNTAAIY
jgi:predicted NAD/FAD-dependent oxidoreductase